jgi:hypothetical protein
MTTRKKTKEKLAMTLDNGIKILDGVDIPDAPERRSYPFNLLEIGQCFMVDFDDQKHLNSIRSSVAGWNKKYRDEGREYVARRIPDTDSSVGVWRIS